MPRHVEIDSEKLQKQIEELHEAADGSGARWVRYIGLSTALLAVFAAVAALRSGNLVNEALIHQLQASDTWSEYQSARQKEHVYTLALNGLLDAGAKLGADPPRTHRTSGEYGAKTPSMRASEYLTQITYESGKETPLMNSARAMERASAEELERHHRFEYSIALVQIAIALGAVAALTRVKSVWFVSLGAGAIGLVLMAFGFL
ncbi:MAG TPA: DUF4337 domain-containing protein [Candidatus Acidoferrales bacterium]|nr:DUF4337 domain-containing protein [Candidatus Acidoferrales bacterium]